MLPHQKIHLHFIHGFLGLPSDWHTFAPEFQNFNCHSYSIENFIEPKLLENPFQNWVNNFHDTIFSPHLKSANATNAQHILIGYSLGGRLALHALLNAPHKWHAAIIISANPGLISLEEKQARIAQDEMWAQRFLTQEWNKLLEEWNGQGVFAKQENKFERKEHEFDRSALAYQLTHYSLGKQENLRPQIKDLKMPILWMSGELDTKFNALAKEMPQLNKNITHASFSQVGHRVPWENSQEFTDLTKKFIHR